MDVLLAVDVGNTNTIFAVYDPGDGQRMLTARASSWRDRMPDEWYAILAPVLASAGIAPRDLTAMIVSSVVPGITRWITEMGSERLGVKPVVVNVGLDLGIRVLIDNPAEAGTDRILNAIAARHKDGCPAIVVDLGTATNFDVVTEDGDYAGGALAPGLMISFEALASRAARLYAVELKLPEHAIGTNTTTAIQSGVVMGYLAMIEGMIQRISAEMEGNPVVVITGGYAELFANHSSLIDVADPDLTTDGLLLVYQRLAAKERKID
jgi:type III pantothenate kinase